ncbi:Ig-like domain-containing protein [Chitinophaga nivalis]|uniref:T9SS type A sorting domain-containing protein n=1 Tax=Chitinophaga nivalis TaxID=2991709 RepID=A0ABT3INE9_9BACT|nr:T9SS type A sorting domain-containing protein [Chitinophaga nivalis]MCW3465064.1 T9SS type A sorting domain-containing protein [Chitinophaga nivalis]MCW3485244.1 T9SS type A sorting domain-containing protein [Chitinophaga nivalis]
MRKSVRLRGPVTVIAIIMVLLMTHFTGYAQKVYANRQTNQINGLCLLCFVNEPENPVNSNSLDDYSTFVITAGLLGVSVEQTLIFPAASTPGCDSLIIGIGSGNTLLSVNLFGGVTVETFNGNRSNNDAQGTAAGVIRLLDNNRRAEIAIKPAKQFDRVKITLSSSLAGVLENFRLYYAHTQPATPAAPVVVPSAASICSGDSVLLSAIAPNSTTVSWYTSSTGGTAIATGNTLLVTPAVTTTYYAAITQGSCTGSRTPVTITVKPTPETPALLTVPPICSGDSVTLTAVAAADATIIWFDAPVGGTAFAIGKTVIVKPATTTTYYAAAKTNGCSSARAAVTVTVNPAPAAPVVSTSTNTVCSGDSVILSATAAAGATITWYDTPTGGTPLATGNTFKVYPTVTTTYYAVATVGSCSSRRVPVTVTVNAKPEAPVITTGSSSICSGDSVLLSATVPAGVTVTWFNTPTGGTPLATGTTYLVTPAATTTYYAAASNGSCSSVRVPVTITVNPQPADPVIANVPAICKGDSVLLSATVPAGVTVNWYDAPTGGTLLATGNTFKVIPAATTTYYAVATQGSCSSRRVPVTVTINPQPTPPVIANVPAICSGDSVLLSATAPAGATVTWYNVSTGGTPLATGNTYRVKPTVTTTYYAAAAQGSCASSRTPVTVTVNPRPALPVVPAVPAVCNGDSVTLIANVPAGVNVVWYNSNSTGATPIGTGTPFRIKPTATGLYYAAATLGTCSSSRVSVNVVVNPRPVAPVIPDATVCSGDSITLTATVPAGVTVTWYSVSTGGTPLATGNTYTVKPTVTTTYYAAATQGSCTSNSRTAVTVTVGTPPAPPAVGTTTPICSGDSITLTASAPAGTTIAWYNTPTGGTPLATGNTYTVKPTVTTTYYAAALQGSCGSSRTPVTVTVNPKPAAPVITPVSGICAGDTLVLSATTTTAGAVITWYNTATGGTPLATGNTYVVAPATTTTYYAAATLGNCTSGRTPVTVTVTTKPAPPVVATPPVVCSGDSVTLTATVPAGVTVTWYSANGTLLAIGNTYTVKPTATTTYYAAASKGSCSSGRTPVTVTVGTRPATPVLVAGAAVCAGDSITLTAIVPAGVIVTWYNVSTGGTPLATGNTYTVKPAVTTTYYASAGTGTCASPRSAVTAVVNQRPGAPTVAADTVIINSGETAVLIGTSPTGAAFTWYNAQVGGTALYSGNPFSTAPTATTTYFVSATLTCCEGPRRPVTVIVRGSIIVKEPTTAKENTTVTTDKSASALQTLDFYPNPTSGLIQIRSKQELNGSQLIVTDLHGQSVYREILRNNSVRLPDAVPAGIYILQVKTRAGQQLTGKVIITR